MALNSNILNGFIKDNDCVLVGVSGGEDSMCLLNLIYQYSKECCFNFYAVHVNHGIRGEEALRDQNFVEEFCKERKIPFILRNVDSVKYAKESLKTLEQAARDLRYDVFNNLMQELKANKLFVAHHKDDQAETVLMHILRGSSLKGAVGMTAVKGNIYRPLLSASRKDIEEYNIVNKIAHVTDSSNNDSKYTRNYLRNVIIPKLKEIYPNVVNSLCNFALNCEKDEDYILNYTNIPDVICKNNEVYIEISSLNRHYSVSSRLIKKACEKLGVFADIEQKHINNIILLKDKQNGKQIELPHNLIAIKNYNSIIIMKVKEKKEMQIPFKLGVFKFDDFGELIIEKVDKNAINLKNKDYLFVDLDKIPQNAVIRFRKIGDVFKKFCSGEKKLSEYFTDKKIPKIKRNLIPLVASGKNVLIISGVEISDSVKVSQETNNVLKITVREF